MLPGAFVATVLGDQVQSALHPAGGLNYWLIGGVAALVIGLIVAFRKRAMRIFGGIA